MAPSTAFGTSQSAGLITMISDCLPPGALAYHVIQTGCCFYLEQREHRLLAWRVSYLALPASSAAASQAAYVHALADYIIPPYPLATKVGPELISREGVASPSPRLTGLSAPVVQLSWGFISNKVRGSSAAFARRRKST